MKIINYTDLDDLKDTAREYGLDKDLTETSMSYSFRIFRGRTCTELHILHLANIKDKKIEAKADPIKAAAPLRIEQENHLSVVSPTFQHNDGGRSDAGFKGSTGDCVCRAICIATGKAYKEVYDALAKGNATQRLSKAQAIRVRNAGKHNGPNVLAKIKIKTASKGINTDRKWFSDYMKSLGFVWVPTMFIGKGCQVHLKAEELPAGRLVISLSRHMTAVIDGVIQDTYDCSRGGTRCVYGYFELRSSPVV